MLLTINRRSGMRRFTRMEIWNPVVAILGTTATGAAAVPAGHYVSALISKDAKVQGIASRPFPKDCSGFVLVEGAWFFIL